MTRFTDQLWPSYRPQSANGTPSGALARYTSELRAQRVSWHHDAREGFGYYPIPFHLRMEEANMLRLRMGQQCQGSSVHKVVQITGRISTLYPNQLNSGRHLSWACLNFPLSAVPINEPTMF